MPYTPHDWSPATWALLLTCMILFVLAIASLYLFLATRAYDLPSSNAAPSQEDAALESPTIPVQHALTDITHDELEDVKV